MAASPSAFSTKLSAPLRRLFLRTSAVSLAGKFAVDRTPAVFDSVQKPVLGSGVDNSVLFRRVDSPVTRSLSQLALKKSVDDDDDYVDDGSVPLDESDFDDDEIDFGTSDEDFDDEDDDDNDDNDQKS